MATKVERGHITTLIVATTFSELLLRVAIQEREWAMGSLLFLSPNREVVAAAKPYGINPIFLSIENKAVDWVERDHSFREFAMPGEGLDFNLPEANLLAWKVLGLDRLNFWYQNDATERLAGLISGIGHNRLLVSVDLSTSLCWSLAANESAIGILAKPVKSREMLDCAKYLPFESLLVESEIDKSFLVGAGFSREINVVTDDTPPPVITSPTREEKSAMRRGLGISDSQKVVLVFFEAQTEWAFRRWLINYIPSSQVTVFIFPENSHAKKILLEVCNPTVLSTSGMILVDSMSVELAADEFYCFRYRDDVVRQRRIPVKIMDVADRFKSSVLMQ